MMWGLGVKMDRTHKTVTFKKGGPKNTPEVMNILTEYLANNKVDLLIISSTTGYTYDCIKQQNIKNTKIMVCCQDLNNKLFMSEKKRQELFKQKVNLYDIPRRFLKQKIGVDGVDILRKISEGTKVCIEMMEFLIDQDILFEPITIVLVAGTIRGADTAIVIKYEEKNKYKVNEFLCFPLK